MSKATTQSVKEYVYHRRGIDMPNLKMKLAPGPGFFVKKKGNIRKDEGGE